MHRMGFWFVGVGLLVMVLQGCNDLMLPAGTLGATEPDTVAATVQLEADQIYPTQGPVGTEVAVFGRGRVFPTGFYRVVFTGGAQVEFFQAAATGTLTVDVPVGARSGPFGFIVGSSPSSSGVSYAPPSPDGYASYSVRDPGFRVTEVDPWITR